MIGCVFTEKYSAKNHNFLKSDWFPIAGTNEILELAIFEKIFRDTFHTFQWKKGLSTKKKRKDSKIFALIVAMVVIEKSRNTCTV